MLIDTRVGVERVAPSWLSASLLRGMSSGFPLASHLAFPGSEPVLGDLRVLLCACASAKVDSSKEAYE